MGYEIEEKIEEKLFHFENIKDDYENLILPCLYSKVQSRNIKLDHAEIKEFCMNIHDNCIGGTANDFTGTEFFNAAGLYAGGNQLFIGIGGGLESEEKGEDRPSDARGQKRGPDF